MIEIILIVQALLCVGLFGIVLFQHVFFMREIQKLVDKAMSRSFTEYVRAQDPVKVKVADSDPPEDLRILQGFQI